MEKSSAFFHEPVSLVALLHHACFYDKPEM
jgi:hypothetical protein